MLIPKGNTKKLKGMLGYRVAILTCIGLLLLLLAAMVSNLAGQLKVLSVAEDDNMQWSITQLETEFANLNAALSDQLADAELSDDELRLRVDIAISRLGIINSGRAAKLFADNVKATEIIEPINAFGANVIEIVDTPGTLSVDALRSLRALTRDVRPNVRKLALLGIEITAKQSATNRAEFSNQLKRTGSITIVLLVLMAALMLLLDRLLHRAIRNDAELLKSSRFLESTIGASLDAIVSANEKGEIIEFNAAAERIFGWTQAEIIGQPMDETFVPFRMREAYQVELEKFLAEGSAQLVDGGRVELSALRKSGEEFPVELNITSVADDDGTKFISYIRDISERKINEQKIIDARDRAERTDKAKSHFLTVMSHEMRTPLNGILGVLDLLKTTDLNKQQSRYADVATASGEILLEHINEALDITRIENDTLEVVGQNFDLSELINSIVNSLEPLAHEKHVGLMLRIDDAMRNEFHGDSNRIRQIVMNLIGNAIKFSDQGQINIRINGINGPEMSSVKVSVTDTGAGIKAQHCEQIFEDFVALAHSENGVSHGNGLGLSTSRKIARLMGGDISVVSELGDGSTFTLTLPLQRVAQVNELSVADPNLATAEQLEILVVEDNDINRKVLGDMLKGMGHKVSEAVNGLDGLECVRNKRFDVIFMDISMPEMDGIEATRRIRDEAGLNAGTYIAGLTAHGREEFRDTAEQAGMTSFHMKPIRLKALREILSQFATVEIPQPAASDLSDALFELCSALGPDLVQETGQKFLKELNDFIADIRSETLRVGTVELAEAAHKIKGAAALLGQQKLERPLQEIEADARDGSIVDLSEKALTIEAEAVLTRAEFAELPNTFRERSQVSNLA